ncbi:lytic murein transglycosylase [Sneathiella marina]|uniref:Lytic murein transglycosylase n=1 Tax=Sneathiella marina TaxID=2950108 RepID=A0ABY4W0D7_9PROT|nr:lytic murein transglycosylase [Sneathiella marina]USG59558.1 lytic murein transglycosylase [Sneathiella marina]
MAKQSTRFIFSSLLCICFLAFAKPGFAAKEKFDVWLANVKTEALAKGISQPTIDAAFANVKILERVVALDRKQPETVETFQQYMKKRLPKSLVDTGKARLNENREVLEEVGRKYGVQPRFIVALWGVETRFGKYTGGFSVIDALTTLAYDNRRAAYFRKELFLALQILEEKHIAAADMKGSWAGAMGQSQFMPSSFVNFAEDHDEDGRTDIWTTKADVFASAANYLSKSGWKGDQTWGREVTLPEGFDVSLVSLKVSKPMQDWQDLGVRKASGQNLPSRQLKGSLVQPKGGNGQTFLVYNNYRTILKWNRSTYFAMSVGQLADLIGDG